LIFGIKISEIFLFVFLLSAIANYHRFWIALYIKTFHSTTPTLINSDFRGIVKIFYIYSTFLQRYYIRTVKYVWLSLFLIQMIP